LRLGVLTLAVGVAAFGIIYYQDQHVDAGPSMVERQIEGAEAAVKKSPSNIGIRLQLATAYRSDKRNDDALEQYDEILKADGNHRAALLGRGNLMMAKGDLNAAAVAYRKITGKALKGEFAGQDLQLAEAHYFLGSIAVTQGKTKVAITELDAALKIDRTDSDALYLMGVARLKDGSTQLAIDAFKHALRFVPTGWCEPHSQLAAAYGKLAQAPQKTYATAMADFCHKRPADAKRQLRTLTTGPVAVEALLGLGLIAETESSNAEAISWYKKVLTVDRRNISAISALAGLGEGPTGRATSSSPTQGHK
jgi:tetratricopeptide (TPR) repeat protein